MSYSLSLLDKSPIADGATAADALRFTTTLARRAEQLGYERFWVAEHHGAPGFASSAPEIVVAHLLAHTSRIRVGSGGVMLQHYSPFKVAETFKLLAALAPGRVDLGIGKAPGGLPLTTRALQWFHDNARKPDFAGQLAELDAFLGWGVAEDHPLAGAVAMPVPPDAPERILLGGSPGSGELAARHGWRFCYAGHFNGDDANLERSLAAYRDAGGTRPLVALYAIAARISEFGFTPNRVAALGENIILLVNLMWSAWLYARFLSHRSSFARLERWQIAYLPVFSVWAAFVVVVFPPMFGYR